MLGGGNCLGHDGSGGRIRHADLQQVLTGMQQYQADVTAEYGDAQRGDHSG